MTIEESTFENCVSKDLDGGALRFFETLEVDITKSIFRNNKANNGGAISFENDQAPSGTYKIDECTFEQNVAVIKGGAMSYTHFPPTVIDEATMTYTDN